MKGGRQQWICRHFNTAAGCRWGQECTFTHEKDPSPQATSTNGKGGRQILLCHFFNTPSGCTRGSACTYIHEKESPSETTPTNGKGKSAGKGDGKPRRKTMMCRYFQMRGRCRDGADCTYAHNEAELDTTPGQRRFNFGTSEFAVTSWLRELASAQNPDEQLGEIHRRTTSGQLMAAISGFSLADIEYFVDILHNMQAALRPDKLEETLKKLAPVVVQKLALSYVSQVNGGEKLDALLEVLTMFAAVDAASTEVLDLPKYQNALEAAVSSSGSASTQSLFSRLEKVRREPGAALSSIVRRQAQAAARAAEAAVPELAEVEELPTMDELLEPADEVLPNRIGAWDNDEEERYRTTHYMLLREELLAPLREAVASFFESHNVRPPGVSRILEKSKGGGPSFFAFPDTEVVGFSVSKSNQMSVQVKFSVGRRRIDFSLGNHLIYGSLVILFEIDAAQQPVPGSAIYATVEEFDLEQVTKKSTIGLAILDAKSWQKFNVAKKYVMVESPGYFHAVAPVLKWLRDPTSMGHLRLRDDLLSGERESPVDYLQGVRIDISCLYKRELPKKERWMQCDPLQPWPDHDDIELDPAQQDALRHILSCSVPLVQGPPGTGKSYLGVKAVQLAIQALRQKGHSEPIILICLTNHALDQFLEDLLDIFPGEGQLIRFGGRSKSEDPRLKECHVAKFLRSSREDYEERKHMEKRLQDLSWVMQRQLHLLKDEQWQMRLFSASLRGESLLRLVEALGEDCVEAGLYLPIPSTYYRGRKLRVTYRPADPAAFVANILSQWLHGASLDDALAAAQEATPQLGETRRVTTRNRYAGLLDEHEEEPEGGSQQILSAIDRQVGARPESADRLEATLNNGLFWSEADEGYDEADEDEEEAEEDLDDDEVLAMLDDREEDFAFVGSRRDARRRELQATAGATDRAKLSEAIKERAMAFKAAEDWEREVQQTQLKMKETIDWVHETMWKEKDRSKVERKEEFHNRRHQQTLNKLMQRKAELQQQWSAARRNCRQRVLETTQKWQQGVFGFGKEGDSLEASADFPEDAWRMPWHQRAQHVKSVVDNVASSASEFFQEKFQEAQERYQILTQMKKQAQMNACRRASVIGMTSTFAALNCDLLKRLSARVVIVEEAGELLECQLMACLSSAQLQHVILIGDHQQLRPKVNSFELCRKKNFDISLFERLIKQGADRAQLVTQLRMRPSICDLVRPFYTRIEDHVRVTKYPDAISGVSEMLQWITHNHEEDNASAALAKSKSNTHEAKMACRLAQHLVLNGINKAKITLLTPYIGQKRLMKKLLHKDLRTTYEPRVPGLPVKDDAAVKGKGKGKGKGKAADDLYLTMPGIRTVTIDDYQGEENDVVIVSLVRNNEKGKLGFVAIENRIIVALSRARHGMYILGNAEKFRTDDKWYRVLSRLRADRRVAEGINLRCAKHPDTEGLACCAEDFDAKAKYGGCKLPCDALLPRCGHKCPLRCHPFDPEHQDVACTQQCARPRPAGCQHKCPKICSDCLGKEPDDVCPTPCQMKVNVTLPCGHNQKEPCHRVQDSGRLDRIHCKTEVTVTLECGHQIQTSCYMANHRRGDLECQHQEVVQGACGHQLTKICRTIQPCTEPCPKKFEPCGHPCQKRCGEVHDHAECSHPCNVVLPCGHPCENLCGQPHTVFCSQPCSRTCAHGSRCIKQCYERCSPCKMLCNWSCKHKRCSKLCHEPCNRERCEQQCDKMLRCGHVCRGLCGEPCPPCVVCMKENEMCPLSMERLRDLTKLYTLECGHTFDLKMLDMHMDATQQSGEHVAIQAKSCPTCRKPVLQAPRYGSLIKQQLVLVDKVKEEVLKKHARNRELTDEERREVDRAMGSGGIYGSGGRWFACPNGHPYFIGDCGGAMVEATCPECGATIGGGSHRLRADNRYVANFTGEGDRPAAWPGVNM
eukprot:TRINITY_DN81241_c0_g1_i1.p1 TRINITY_DN81241_c0_g1~~TRINITY_DN81241_c0_g1_i1.p1  ORF type:complete len:1920 (-),score=396.55 TRINITY_DN81241_c0_g1_i1:69-5828(-)